MAERVLVTGATGNIGSQLVTGLTKYGDINVSAFVRDEGKAATLKEAGAELAVGTFEDPGAVRSAVDGVDTIVLITAPNPNAADQASGVLAASKDAGVRKVVRISALKASTDGPTDNTRQHGRTDDEIRSSGLTYTILRPHFFMQNVFMSAQSIASEGKMYWGMGDGKLGMIDVRDIVDCAVKCVRSDEYDNQILNLTGPESISFHDVANSLADGLQRPVNYVPVPVEAVEQCLHDMGMGDWFPVVMRDYSDAYSNSWGDFVTADVERVTGHPARSIDVFTREVFAPALSNGG